MTSWKNKQTTELFNAFLKLKTVDEVANFCRDLMTEPEILEFAARWQIAQELDKGKSQRQIAADNKVALATVTRVNQWLKRGMGGYRLVLERINSLHHHTRPAGIVTS